MALNTSLKSVLDGLLKTLGLNLAGLDYEEQDKRRGLETNLVNAAKARQNSLKSSSIGMADRGFTQSGVALEQATKLNQASDQNVAGLNEGFNNDLSGIARKRLQAEGDYNLKKLELEHQAVTQAPIIPTPVSAPSPVSVASGPSQQTAMKAILPTAATPKKQVTAPKTNYSVTKSAPPPVKKIATPVAKAPPKSSIRYS